MERSRENTFARLWRRWGPWLTPALLAVEVALVWSGGLSVVGAVVIAVVVEALLAVTAIGRGLVAVRHYRAGRHGGRDGWAAAQDGLAQLLPARAARAVLIEARMWVCLLHALLHGGPTGPHAFTYARGIRPLMRVVLALLVFEGAIVEGILVAALGHSPWVWIALGLHLYGLVWTGGFLGSLRVLPHQVGPRALLLRDSVFTTIAVPYAAIAAATVRTTASFGRSGFALDEASGSATFAYGDATVDLALHPDSGVTVNGRPAPPGLRVLRVTADDPHRFVQVLTTPAQ